MTKPKRRTDQDPPPPRKRPWTGPLSGGSIGNTDDDQRGRDKEGRGPEKKPK